MDKVLEGLYLGNLSASRDIRLLRRHHITHLISVHDSPQAIYPELTYLCVHLEDRQNQNISQYFGECIEFIHKTRAEGGNVLVHCLSGVSRGPTIVIAYLLTLLPELNISKAVDLVYLVCRSQVCPNAGFMRQLSEWKRSHRKHWVKMLKRWPEAFYPDSMRAKSLLELARIRERSEGVETDSVSQLDLREELEEELEAELETELTTQPTLKPARFSDQEDALLEHRPIIMGNHQSYRDYPTHPTDLMERPKKQGRLQKMRSALRSLSLHGKSKPKSKADGSNEQEDDRANNNGFVTKLNGSYYTENNDPATMTRLSDPASAGKATLLRAYRDGISTLPLQYNRRATSQISVNSHYSHYSTAPRRSVHIPERMERRLVRSKSTGVLSEAEIRQQKTRTASVVKINDIADWEF